MTGFGQRRPADRVPLRPAGVASSRALRFRGSAHGLLHWLKKDLIPDNPRNLSAWLFCGEHESIEKPEMPRFARDHRGRADLDLILYGLPESFPRNRATRRQPYAHACSSSAIVTHNLAALGVKGRFLVSCVGDDPLGPSRWNVCETGE